jgi:L-malate glycosyltransferase
MKQKKLFKSIDEMIITNGKINVMHVVLSLETGGLERIVADSVLAIDKDKFNVEVCCLDRLGSFAELLIEQGNRVMLLQRNQFRYDYLFPLKLRKHLIEKNVHILHIHSGTFFLATQAGILARTPVMIYTDHGRPLVESRIDVLMDRFSGHFVDQIVAVSNKLKEYLIKQIKLPENKLMTLINGINTESYCFREKSQTLLQEFRISPNHKVIGTVGRLAEVKDYTSLIEAFDIVHNKLPDTALILVGDGPMRTNLEQKIVELNLKGFIKLAGNRTDIPNLLNLFDLFVLSSLSEGTSVALLEAMASRVAPIVTNVGGNPSIVDNNINGILVKPNNVDELADNLISLLQDDERRKKYGENAAQKVRVKFSLAKMVNEYERLYIRLLNGKLKTPYQPAGNGG